LRCTLKKPAEAGFFAANKKWPGAIFNAAPQRPARWPPGMAGNKKPPFGGFLLSAAISQQS